MLAIFFWFMVIVKPLFWMVFPGNYFWGTALWAGVLITLTVLQMARTSFRIAFFQDWSLYVIFLYCAFAFLRSFGSEFGSSFGNVFYALLPLAPLCLYCGREPVAIHLLGKQFAAGIASGAFALSLVSIMRLGFWGLHERFEGIEQIGPNVLGFGSSIGLFCIVYLRLICGSLTSKYLYIGCAVYFISVLVATFSKTSIFAVLLVIVIMYFKFNSLKNALRSLAVAVLIVMVGVFFFDYLDKQLSNYLEWKYRADTLSGRTLLWEEILSYMNGLELLMGMGANASREFSQIAGWAVFQNDSVYQAHNLLVEAVVNFGVVGAFLLIVPMIRSLLLLARNDLGEKGKTVARARNLCFSLWIILVVRSICDASAAQLGSVESILVPFLVALTAALRGTPRLRFTV